MFRLLVDVAEAPLSGVRSHPTVRRAPSLRLRFRRPHGAMLLTYVLLELTLCLSRSMPSARPSKYAPCRKTPSVNRCPAPPSSRGRSSIVISACFGWTCRSHGRCPFQLVHSPPAGLSTCGQLLDPCAGSAGGVEATAWESWRG